MAFRNTGSEDRFPVFIACYGVRGVKDVSNAGGPDFSEESRCDAHYAVVSDRIAVCSSHST